MTGRYVFYRLSAKFLDRSRDIPEDAKDVVYYSLAIGHHIGVVDCFTPALSCPATLYDRVIASLPRGAGREKLEGLRIFGEITIDRTHTKTLTDAVGSARSEGDAEVAAWLDEFMKLTEAIDMEPAIYLIGRAR